MANLSDKTVEELAYRFDSLLKVYVELAAELVPKLEKFGRHRKELQSIALEFKNRGVKHDDPESLVALLKEEVEKNNVSQPDQK